MKRFFRTVSAKDKSEITGWWDDEESSKFSCSCAFGSFYGQSKKNKGKMCRHLKAEMEKVRNGK